MAKHSTFNQRRPDTASAGEYITIRELAEWLGISRGSAWNIVMYRGDIPHVRLTSRTVRIACSDVETYLERCRSDS